MTRNDTTQTNEQRAASAIDHDDCPECGQRKSYHPTTGEYCLYCGWVESLHTPGPWMVTRDPSSKFGSFLEPSINEQLYLEELGPDHPKTPFLEALVELHSANNERLIDSVPELYALYLVVKQLLEGSDYHHLPESVKCNLGRALDRVEQTRIRYLDRNVKSLMEEE
jgi:hypothetical protein